MIEFNYRFLVNLQTGNEFLSHINIPYFSTGYISNIVLKSQIKILIQMKL